MCLFLHRQFPDFDEDVAAKRPVLRAPIPMLSPVAFQAPKYAVGVQKIMSSLPKVDAQDQIMLPIIMAWLKILN